RPRPLRAPRRPPVAPRHLDRSGVEKSLIQLVVRRLVAAVVVAFCVATFAFFALHAAPGGPFDSERQLRPEVKQNIERAYHLDRPLGAQYLAYRDALLRA